MSLHLEEYLSFVANLGSTSTPRMIDEALQDPTWKQAMSIEMDALLENDTWELSCCQRRNGQ